jgi:hypothetical protein
MCQSALTMFLSTLFWNRGIMSILLWCNPRFGHRTSKRVLVFVCIEVCYEGTVPSYQPILFLYLRPSSSRFFLTWAFQRSLAS